MFNMFNDSMNQMKSTFGSSGWPVGDTTIEYSDVIIQKQPRTDTNCDLPIEPAKILVTFPGDYCTQHGDIRHHELGIAKSSMDINGHLRSIVEVFCKFGLLSTVTLW